jgi:YVTN family beta-propeller protein
LQGGADFEHSHGGQYPGRGGAWKLLVPFDGVCTFVSPPMIPRAASIPAFPVAVLLLASVLCPYAPAQGGPDAFDDQKGRFISFEVGPVRSLAWDGVTGDLLALNQVGARLVVLHPQTLAIQAQVPIGLGAASLAVRPGTREAWVVDRVSGTVQVVDLERQTVVRTIRVGAEPHGIAFAPEGERAWVTCSADDTVVTLDAAAYSVAGTHPFGADTPRGVTWHAGRAWIASFLSGNNTVAQGRATAQDAALLVVKLEGAGVNPLPDLDLFPLQPGATPAQDVLDAAGAVRGLGAVLFDVIARPGTSELWIPSTEALNAEHRGETSFVDGQVVSNRIAIHDTSGVAPARIVDLDALAPDGKGCAQPTGLCFDPVRPRVYVCAYGSDVVAVLNLGTDGSITWAGLINIPAKQVYPRGSGPRSCVTDPAGQALYVFNRNDTAVARIELASLPAHRFEVTATHVAGIGRGEMSTEVQLGRHLFTDARNSGSLTSSCASCHVDGNTDNLVWDLSSYLDPEGTAPIDVSFGLDVKGPLVTQGTRRQEEGGPYHWRGERGHLNEFNATFVSLLENEVDGVLRDIGPDFQYMRHHLNRIAIPPNPRQDRERLPKGDAQLGEDLFHNLPLQGSSGPGALTCATCHAGPLGTAGEVVAATAEGVLSTLKVPSLRGIAFREQPEHDAGTSIGLRARNGGGLTHGGVYGLIESTFTARPGMPARPHAFQLTAVQSRRLAAYVRSFDTGLAPSTAWAATAHPGNWTQIRDDDLTYLQVEAARGNCDLIALRTPPQPGMPNFVRTATWDTRDRVFVQAGQALPSLTAAQLLLEAALGRPVTFLGVPRGMGLTAGLDRDADMLMDGDELLRGTNPDLADTDGDLLVDGYEVHVGTNPLAHTTGVPDTTPPQLVGQARLIYATTNTIKFEFNTSEYCRVHVGFNGLGPVQRIPLDHMGDTEHWVVLNNLEPGTTYTIDLRMRDPALNYRDDSTTVFSTLPRQLVEPVRCESIQLTVAGADPQLFAELDFRVGDQPAPAGYVAYGSVWRVPLSGGPPQVVARSIEAATQASGRAVLRASLAGIVGPPGTLFFVLREVAPPAGAAPWARAYSEVFDSIVY